MKTPGFNAESSLYRTHASYRSTGNWQESLTAGRSISAAQALWNNGFDACSHCKNAGSDCAKSRCYCSCTDGWILPGGGKCGFQCG